ncbi:MAG: DUF1178 family protein [Acetobacteraceae bacterium]
MIHYQLRCGRDHEFDGWFKDSAGFDAQARAGLLVCPSCGDARVVRAMMAPAVRARRIRPEPVPAPPADNAPAEVAPAGAVAGKLPDHMRAMLQRLRADVEKNCDDVGDRFADEALRIHRGEAKARGIYGQASPDDAERLSDEGVEFARLPWVPRAEG